MRAAFHQHCRIQRRLLLGLLVLASLHAGRILLGYAPVANERLIRRSGFAVIDREGVERASLGAPRNYAWNSRLALQGTAPADHFINLCADQLSFVHGDSAFNVGMTDVYINTRLDFGNAKVSADVSRETSLWINVGEPKVRLWVVDFPSSSMQRLILSGTDSGSSLTVGYRGCQPTFAGSPAARPAGKPGLQDTSKGKP